MGLEPQAEGMEWVADQQRAMEGSLPQPLCHRGHGRAGRASFWTNNDVGFPDPIEDQVSLADGSLTDAVTFSDAAGHHNLRSKAGPI